MLLRDTPEINDTPDCARILRVVPKYSHQLWDTRGCSRIPQMLHDIPGCFIRPIDALVYSRMFQDTPHRDD
jgi:hypothetical protein